MKLRNVRLLFACSIVSVLGGTLETSFAAPADGKSKEPIAVFILAGQSNMVGQGDGAALPEALRTGNDRVVRWVDGKWQALRPIKPAPANFKKRGIKGPTFGPDVSFGAEIGKAWPARRIGIVKVSVGGTGILAWSPKWTREQADRSRDGKKGDLYAQILQQVAAIRKTEPVELKGFFWMQGGKDMRYPDLADEYADNLKTLIISLRKDLKAPDLPAFIAAPFDPRVLEGGAKDSPEMKRILESRPGALKVAAAWVDAGKAIPDTVPVSMPDLERWPQNVHYNTAGCLKAGRLFAKAYLESLK